MSYAGFIEPLNILGFPGFEGQITYGSGPSWSNSFPAWTGDLYGWQAPRWIVDLSLGDGWFTGGAQLASLPGVPPLVSEAGVITEDSFPLQIDLRDTPPLQADLPSPMMTQAQIDQYIAVYGFPPYPGATATAEIVTVDQGDNMSWIEDIYDIIDTSVGGLLPGGVPVGSSLPTTYLPTTIQPTTIPQVPGAPMPVPTVPQANTNKLYCMKFIDGQWKAVKMRRRRRKQLATKGDLQDLAALKGILGTGKAFEVWIATHS